MILKESWFSFCFMVLLTLVSCGHVRAPINKLEPQRRVFQTGDDDPRQKIIIESEFLPLVNRFESFENKPVSTPIYFVDDLAQSVLGVCITWVKGDVTYKEIKVNRSSFDLFSIESEMIIFHELGHCELGRPHDTNLTRLDDGRVIPYSLMYANIFLATDYVNFHDHFILELFGLGSILVKIEDQPLGKPEKIERVYSNGFEGFIYH